MTQSCIRFSTDMPLGRKYMLNTIKTQSKSLILAYLCICLFMWGYQRHLMYHPLHHIGPPEQYGLKNFDDVSLQDADGTHIRAWYHKAGNGYPTLLFFHGNGGDLANESLLFQALAMHGFGVLATDYRGYG